MFFCKRVFMLGSILLMAPMAAMAAQIAPKPVAIEGFRSAHFGMSEADTLKAIKTDFNLSGNAVRTQVNPVQYTTALSVTVPALMPGSGAAAINYVFGYKEKRLIEVDVTWAASAPDNSPKSLLQTGAMLQNYFMNESFPPGSVAGGSLLANGNLLLFRGSDAAGHAVGLFISGPETHDAKASKTNITPALLTLAYVADPAHPDVFTIQPGRF
jgi:hypothetical protein